MWQVFNSDWLRYLRKVFLKRNFCRSSTSNATIEPIKTNAAHRNKELKWTYATRGKARENAYTCTSQVKSGMILLSIGWWNGGRRLALYGAVPLENGLKSGYSFAILVTSIDYVQIFTSQRELCSCGLRSKRFWSSYHANFADPSFSLSFHVHWRTRAETLGTLASVHVNILVYFIREIRFPKETLIF